MTGDLTNIFKLRPVPLRRLLACIFIYLTLFSPSISAQSPNKVTIASSGSQGIGPTLSHILQMHARTVLERHLRPEEFQVFVTVTPAKSPQDPLPYMPETFATAPSAETPVESLALWLQKVEVEVLIADRYNQDAKLKLEAILRKSLALDSKRGDRISFASIGLKVDPPLSDIQRDLVRSEADSRDLKARLDVLGRERDDAKRDLSQTKAELERIAREKSASGKSDKGSHENSDNAAKSPNDHSFWQGNLALIIAGALTLIAILVANLAIRSAARTLGIAVQTIGAGIPALGEKLSGSLSQQSPALLPAPETSSRGPTGDGRLSLDDRTNGASLPMEAVARRVIELHDELMASVTASNEGVVLEHLSWLLDDESSIGHAVATMELLGKDKANDFYKKLASDHQQGVVNFLRSGVHSRPKGEIMLEVGEALKTRLFGAELPSRAKFDQGVRNKLVQIDADDLVQVARSLDGDHLARLFAYIGPAKLAAVMTAMYKVDPTKFAKAASLIAKIPSVESNFDLDHELVAAIESQAARNSSDIHGPYLSYYRSLLQSVDDDVASLISEQISASDVRVERYLRETVVTFATFFKLHGDIQEEIVVGMNNRDQAALMAPLKEELKTKISSHLESRRRELVDEEIQRLIGKGLRQVNAAHRLAKEQVVARIMQIKGNGLLSDLMAQEEGSLATTDYRQDHESKVA